MKEATEWDGQARGAEPVVSQAFSQKEVNYEAKGIDR